MIDTNQVIIKQNEFKKNSRAKHAKLAKASPTPPFLSNYILASLAVFARDTIFSSLLVVGKIQICLARFVKEYFRTAANDLCGSKADLRELIIRDGGEAITELAYKSPCFFILFLNASRLMPSMRAAWT